MDEVTETSGSLTDSVAAIEQQGNKIMGVFDILFVDGEGQKISIESEDGFTMTVRLPFYEQANAGALNDAQVYYIADNGTYTPMETRIENGCVCFKTTHLSTYVVAQSDEQAEEPEDDQKPEDEQKPSDGQKPGDEQKPSDEQKPGDKKPASEQKPGNKKPEAEVDSAKEKGETLVQAGDATLLMSGLAVASSVAAFAGAAITRRH